MIVLPFAALAFVMPPALAAEPLLMTYIDKPPYYYTDAQGEARGFLVERTRQVLAKVGVELRLEARPPNRALQEIRSEPKAVCSIGWFRTIEREEFARFTLPLYHDRPLLAVVVQERAADFSAGSTLAAMLARPGVKVGAVAGYSYGDAVDRMLAPLGDHVDRAPSPTSNLAKLVAGRFDFALFNSEELDHLLAQSPELARRVQRVSLRDAPQGKARHLMCSTRVDAALMERIDRAISQLRFDRP